MRFPRRTVVAVVLAAALVLGGSASALVAFTGASDTGTQAQSGAGNEPPPELSPEARAFLDRVEKGFGDRGSVHVRMTMVGPEVSTAEGETTYGPDGSEMQLTMRTGDERVEMVLVEDAAYVSMSGVTPKGKFFRVPPESPLLANLVATAGGVSPQESFAAFEAGLVEVEELGRKQIGGQPTRHYRLHLDAARATQAQGMAPAAGMPETLVYDVWLDRDDRMRRIHYELAGTRMTMDMTRWDADVSITAPAKKNLVEPPPAP